MHQAVGREERLTVRGGAARERGAAAAGLLDDQPDAREVPQRHHRVAADVDGALVGGASLQAEEFGGICRFYDMPML